METTFSKPTTAGKKANHRVRARSDNAPTISIDRLTPLTTSTTTSRDQTSTTPTFVTHRPADLSVSFQDPRSDPEPQFDLYLKKNLPAGVKRCQGKCGRDITHEEKDKLVSQQEPRLS